MTGYFDSLVNISQSADILNRKTIQEAKSKLKLLLGEQDLELTYNRDRSLLNDSFNNSQLLAQRQMDFLRQNIDEGVVRNHLTIMNGIKGRNPGAKKKSDLPQADQDELSGIEESFSSWLNILVRGLNPLYESFINNLNSIGLISNEYKDISLSTLKVTSNILIFLGVVGVASLIGIPAPFVVANIVSVALNLEGVFNFIGLTASFIADTAVSFFNWLAPQVIAETEKFFNFLKIETDRIYTSYIAPVVETVFNYFGGPVGFDENGVPISQFSLDYDQYIVQTIRDLNNKIILEGLPTALINTVRDFGTFFFEGAGNLVNDGWKALRGWDWVEDSGIGALADSAISAVTNGASALLTWVGDIIQSRELKATVSAISDLLGTIFPAYKDGVSETGFGMAMERSWIGTRNSFLNAISSPEVQDRISVNFLTTTPLDPSEGGNQALYGNMILGTPLTYTEIADPNNRVMINTFVKESVFLSLTPGMPKYNGGAFQQEVLGALNFNNRGSYLTQTSTPQSMLDYLLKNGIDYSFAEKDRRYYTFEAKYSEYYSYLETMLNTVWIKLGLGTAENGSINMFSFFNPSREGVNYNDTLQNKYKSSIGIYVTQQGISESINSSEYTSDISGDADAASSSYQRLNYITGMGTGGTARNVMRQVGIGIQQTGDVIGLIKKNFSTGNANLLSITGFAKGMANLTGSIIDFANSQDMSALMQQFAVTNGMRVMYPKLWESSSYAKNMNFDFNFVSPYGDPLSIFQYVYVPFLTLLAFALPRQAAENGLVSPFFVRADVPGLITSDLALITDINWTKGGPDGTMWTKDKLPRAISGSFTVTDLYPFLASVKRISFLSSNPSFTVFLDNMAGIRALYNDISDDPYAEYWNKLLNRVNGTEASSGLWNVFGADRQVENNRYSRTKRESVSKTINKKSAPWLSKI